MLGKGWQKRKAGHHPLHSAASLAPVLFTSQATGIYTGSVKILPRTTCSLWHLHTNEHKKIHRKKPQTFPHTSTWNAMLFQIFSWAAAHPRISLLCSLPSTSLVHQPLQGIAKRYMLHCHQCTDDTQLSSSFPLDPDTAAGNLKQCLAEIGFWKKASWLLLNLDKAEIMLISRGKCFEDLVKFISAPSAEGLYLSIILSSVQCSHQTGI